MQFGSRRKIFHKASIGTLLNDWWRSDDNDVKENRNHRVSDEESEEHDKT